MLCPLATTNCYPPPPGGKIPFVCEKMVTKVVYHIEGEEDMLNLLNACRLRYLKMQYMPIELYR